MAGWVSLAEMCTELYAPPSSAVTRVPLTSNLPSGPHYPFLYCNRLPDRAFSLLGSPTATGQALGLRFGELSSNQAQTERPSPWKSGEPRTGQHTGATFVSRTSGRLIPL